MSDAEAGEGLPRGVGNGHHASISHIEYILSCLVLRRKETKAPGRKGLGCGLLSVHFILGLFSGDPICLSLGPIQEKWRALRQSSCGLGTLLCVLREQPGETRRNRGDDE